MAADSPFLSPSCPDICWVKPVYPGEGVLSLSSLPWVRVSIFRAGEIQRPSHLAYLSRCRGFDSTCSQRLPTLRGGRTQLGPVLPFSALQGKHRGVTVQEQNLGPKHTSREAGPLVMEKITPLMSHLSKLTPDTKLLQGVALSPHLTAFSPHWGVKRTISEEDHIIQG